eukprot:7380837-Prymnesium_polylepis.2
MTETFPLASPPWGPHTKQTPAKPVRFRVFRTSVSPSRPPALRLAPASSALSISISRQWQRQPKPQVRDVSRRSRQPRRPLLHSRYGAHLTNGRRNHCSRSSLSRGQCTCHCLNLHVLARSLLRHTPAKPVGFRCRSLGTRVRPSAATAFCTSCKLKGSRAASSTACADPAWPSKRANASAASAAEPYRPCALPK